MGGPGPRALPSDRPCRRCRGRLPGRARPAPGAGLAGGAPRGPGLNHLGDDPAGLTMDLVVLAIAFLVILLGAELFTNGIEWFGRKLELAEGAVGSVLAAVGTALPETMIPIIAIGFAGGGGTTDEVGVGAILGAPFMLATLAMFVTGVGVLAFRKRRETADRMS